MSTLTVPIQALRPGLIDRLVEQGYRLHEVFAVEAVESQDGITFVEILGTNMGCTVPTCVIGIAQDES